MSELSVEERLAISDEAKRLLASPMFNGVINSMVKNYMAALISTIPGSADAMIAHARIKGLDDIKNELRALENDGTKIRNDLKKKS